MFQRSILSNLASLVLFSLLVYCPIFGQETEKETIPKVEDKMVKEIKNKDVGKRFVIKEFKPHGEGTDRLTVKKDTLRNIEAYEPDATGSSWKRIDVSINYIIKLEFPEADQLGKCWHKDAVYAFGGDYITIRETFVKAFESAELKTLYVRRPRADFPILGVCFGEGSIYRFDGKIKLNGYTFIGEGDRLNRLTFVILPKGFVYLRGDGMVSMPDGTEIQLSESWKGGSLRKQGVAQHSANAAPSEEAIKKAITQALSDDLCWVLLAASGDCEAQIKIKNIGEYRIDGKYYPVFADVYLRGNYDSIQISHYDHYQLSKDEAGSWNAKAVESTQSAKGN